MSDDLTDGQRVWLATQAVLEAAEALEKAMSDPDPTNLTSVNCAMRVKDAVRARREAMNPKPRYEIAGGVIWDNESRNHVSNETLVALLNRQEEK